MSELELLISQADDLNRKVDYWNVGVLFSLGVTALAAVTIVITQRLAIVRSKQLSDVQVMISEIKERDVRNRADNLQLALESQRERTETASRLAAVANQAAEHERAERLKLEAEIAPRRLSSAQQASLLGTCKPLAGHRVEVVSYSLDAEAAVLAKQIIASLQLAGLTVQDGTASVMPVGGFSLGIHVNGADLRVVSCLSRALQSSGLAVAPLGTVQPQGPAISVPITADGQGASEATILVGVKPPR